MKNIPIPDGCYYLGIPESKSSPGEAYYKIIIKDRKVKELLASYDKNKFFYQFFVSTCNFIIGNNDCCLKDDSDNYPECKYWLISIN